MKLMTLQHATLVRLYPMRRLAWPLMTLGALVFPAMIGWAVAHPELNGDELFTGFVAGLGLVLLGALLALTRPEKDPPKGLRQRARHLWETLVFWSWLVSLLVFASLAIKILSFSGA
ncbi:hypothetical protein [Saccharospirillum alexandrii]|uniref:hypothetical protein n=2 Tax=Saccharospirillum TaxID=231683 RepID=UPI001C6FEAAE|nr:hypothetical protein [Saccharospirillum alexandrii]